MSYRQAILASTHMSNCKIYSNDNFMQAAFTFRCLVPEGSLRRALGRAVSRGCPSAVSPAPCETSWRSVRHTYSCTHPGLRHGNSVLLL